MADIELVIKIDENIAHEIIEGEKDKPRSIVRNFQATIAYAIKNGIPLPKGHGAIKDVSQIEIPMCEDRAYERWVQVAIDSAPTIIAEDKEQE